MPRPSAAATGARVLYITPTLHNPTGRTMSLGRREDIVRPVGLCRVGVM